MAGLNKVMLIGNLGRDPEIRYLQSGNAVVNFSIATSEQWTDKGTGERQEKTEWHRIVVFGKQAETCSKYLSKGSSIYIEGRLQTRSWEKDGQTHYTTEIVASNFQFLGGRSDNQANWEGRLDEIAVFDESNSELQSGDTLDLGDVMVNAGFSQSLVRSAARSPTLTNAA